MFGAIYTLLLSIIFHRQVTNKTSRMQLESISEETSDYESIWGYSIGETEPRVPIFEYPEFDFELRLKMKI